MIDKLNLRIPRMTPFARGFHDIGDALTHGRIAGFHPSEFYTQSGDLRPFGADAFLHLAYKYGTPAHKLELIDTGRKSLDAMRQNVERIFDIDSAKLEIMRIDLCADVKGVPVPWFREHARFAYKQFACKIEKGTNLTEAEFIEMGTADSQTLYAGKRPNCVRIYNKSEEWRHQWRKWKRDLDGYIPAFEEYCAMQGFPIEQGQTVTRIEREIGGGRIPAGIDSVAKLPQSLPEFNPFDRLEIVKRDKNSFRRPPLPDQEGGSMSMRSWLAGVGLESISKEFGDVQTAFSWIRKHARGNGKRLLEDLRDFWPKQPSDSAVGEVTAQEIMESYRSSLLRQLKG